MSGLQRATRHPDRINDPHARALMMASDALLGPLEAADETWLGEHLAGCGPCRAAAVAFAEDAALLRSLRADLPPAPRDLGARVSLALDVELSRARRGRRGAGRLVRRASRPAFDGRPSLAFAGLAAVAVVALLVGPLAIAPATQPAGTPPAGSLLPVATPIVVASQPVAWVRRSSDGTYVLSSAEVRQVCPGVDATACGTLDGDAQTLASLAVKPSSVLLPRDGSPAVIVGQDAVYAVSVDLVPPVTTPEPEPSPVPSSTPVQTPSVSGGPASPPVGSPAPSDPPATPVPTAPASPPPSPPPATPAPTPDPGTPTPAPTVAPPTVTPEPGATEPPSPVPSTPPPSPVPTPLLATIPPATPAPTAAPVLAIAEAVILVGTPPAYSADGRWVAFSARPADGSHGPDIYAWQVGQQKAVALTDDHGSVFSGWIDDRILASAARVAATPATEPSAGLPGPDADPATVVARSYLIDPARADVTEIARDGIWRPVVDPTNRLVVFWTGSLAWSTTDMAWMPARGHLAAGGWQVLLDRGSELVDTVLPAAAVGLDVADWEVRFDPAGRRLGVWVADPAAPGTGRLSLVAVNDDGTLGAVELADAAALPGFSLDTDRLAWSTPPGRNGIGSLVTVFAWSGANAGQLYGMPDPGQEPVVVVR